MKRFNDGLQAIREHIAQYSTWKAQILKLELRKQRYRAAHNMGLKAVEYSADRSSPTNKFSSVVENAVIDIEREESIMESEITYYKSLVNEIEMIMDSGLLTEEEKKTIRYRTIEGKQWWEVSEVVNAGETSCKRYEKSGLKKFERVMVESR